jgi:hypothetical protein
MVYWKSLTNWSLAVNLNDLAASIPFLLAKAEVLNVEIFSSSQGSRIVNMEKSSNMYSSLVRALNPQNSQNQTRKYAQDRSKQFCYASLCCYPKHKALYTELFRYAPHYGRLFRPLSAIVISVATVRRHDVALPSISATVFTTPRSRELTLLSAVLPTPDTRLSQLTVTVPHRL